MASTRKRGDTYQIRVSCGYNNGKRIEYTKKWTPDEGMTKHQIKKELERQALLFEAECSGKSFNESKTFKELIDEWFEEYANLNLKINTIDKTFDLSKRVVEELGDIKIESLTTKTIQLFINGLAKEGANKRTGKPLAPKTVRNYFGFISDVLSYAVRMGMIPSNPCRNVSVPKINEDERDEEKPIYSIDEMNTLLLCLENEPMRYKAFFYLLANSGLRKGEMLGLEWHDIDFEKRTVRVVRTSNHTTYHGTFTGTPKSKNSRRPVKISNAVIELLKQLKTDQEEKAEMYGSKWIPTKRVFTAEFGGVMGRDAPYDWLKKFCRRNNLPFYGIHTFRHFVASALIHGGLDVTTVSRTLGHSKPTTTLNIYSHLFKNAQEESAEVMEKTLGFGARKKDA